MVSIAFNSVCARYQPTRIEDHVIAREAIFDPQSSASMAVGMRMLLKQKNFLRNLSLSGFSKQSPAENRFVVPPLGGGVGRGSIP